MKRSLSTVTIIGVGLIGGSFGLAIKRRGLAGHVIGAGRSQASLDRARDLGAIDEIAADVRNAVKRSSFVFLAAPVRAICRSVESIAPLVSRTALVTDAGSTKTAIVSVAERLWGSPVMFVGSHPMAGSEKSGVEYATPELFEGRIVAITPTDRTDRDAVEAVVDVWHAIGAQTIEVSPERHDEIVARTSHVPHVIAALLVSLVQEIDSETTRKLAGTGLRDSTRLADSSSEMWRDICMTNNANIREGLREFRKFLDQTIESLAQKDDERLLALFRDIVAYRKTLFGDRDNRNA